MVTKKQLPTSWNCAGCGERISTPQQDADHFYDCLNGQGFD